MPPYQSSYPINEITEETCSIDLLPVKKDFTDGISHSIDNASSDFPSRRRVTFADVDQVHSVLSREEYTELEHRSTWVSTYENCQSEFHRDEQISLLSHGKPCKSDMTYRGLERLTPSGAEHYREIALEVRRVVMEEQLRQKALQIYDPEALAIRSSSISVVSQQQARDLAKQDEQDVQPFSSSDRAKRKGMLKARTRWWSLSVSKTRS
jgi:hypothetical protein